MKINKATIPYILILLFIIVIESDFFGIITLPDLVSFILYKNRSKWIAPLAVSVGVFCWMNHRTELKQYRGFLRNYLTVVTVSVLILYIDALIRYPKNELITTYGFGTYYFYSFLAIPVVYLFEKQGGIQKFLKYLTVIVCILYAVSVIQGISYIRTGSLLFGKVITNIGAQVRDGKIRMGGGAFDTVMLLYSIYVLYNNRNAARRNNKSAWILLILGLLNIAVTGHTRIALLSVGIASVILIYMGDGGNKKKAFAWIIIAAGIVFMFGSGFVGKIWDSFSTSGDYAGSTIARLGAWKYYFGSFLSNPLSAIGFAGDENYYDLVHGDSGIYYQTVLVKYDYSDCGFIGLLAQTGVFSFFIYIWPLIRFGKMALHYLQHKLAVPGAFIIALFSYLVVTSATLSILDAARVIAWPVVIAVCEYCWIHKNDIRGKMGN